VQEVKNHIELIKKICQDHFVSQFSLFGSMAKGEMKGNSEIDILVSFNNKLNLLDYADNFFGLKNQLESLFEKEVDLVTEKSIKNPILRQEIENFKVLLYEA